ncbi:salivary glue protein Sgs-3-like [Haliotis cracherodii]|uniref:salivary glue protein Sgs-3-like n=1 Tax=Haliotis cracherodii TaxID=6455 RepID=UPI0039EAD86C
MNALLPVLVALTSLWGTELHLLNTRDAGICKSGRELRKDCRISLIKSRCKVIKELWWCKRRDFDCGYTPALDLVALRRDIANKRSCCGQFKWFDKFEIRIQKSIENLEICRDGPTTKPTPAEVPSSTTPTTTTSTTSSAPATTLTTSATTISTASTTTPTSATTTPTTSATTTTQTSATTTPAPATTTPTTSTTTTPTTSATTTTPTTSTTTPTPATTTPTTSTTTTSATTTTPTTSTTTRTSTSATTTTPTTSATTTTPPTSASTTTPKAQLLCGAIGGSCLFTVADLCISFGGQVDEGRVCLGASVCCVF